MKTFNIFWLKIHAFAKLSYNDGLKFRTQYLLNFMASSPFETAGQNFSQLFQYLCDIRNLELLNNKLFQSGSSYPTYYD